MKTNLSIKRIPNPITLLAFMAGAAIAAPIAVSAESFEGELTMKVSSQGSEEEIDFSVKGTKMRVEVEERGQEMSMIMDFDEREMMMVMPAQRSYMTMSIPDPSDLPNQPDPEDFEWEETDETEEILGYTATKFTARDGRSESEIWATEELGSLDALFMNEPGHGETGTSPLEEALRDRAIFPLRIIERNPAGQEMSRMEVTRVEAKELSADLFEPPADFQHMQMPSF